MNLCNTLKVGNQAGPLTGFAVMNQWLLIELIVLFLFVFMLKKDVGDVGKAMVASVRRLRVQM